MRYKKSRSKCGINAVREGFEQKFVKKSAFYSTKSFKVKGTITAFMKNPGKISKIKCKFIVR